MLRRIYYLEDNERLGEMLQISLNRINSVCPVEIKVFGNIEDFWNGVKLHKPNLVILDLMLPDGEDGFEVLEDLKADHNTKEIPVIIVSAKLGEYERCTCIDAGAAQYFTKPFFSFDEINSTVKSLLKLSNDDTIVICGDIVIDSTDQSVTRSGELLDIAHTEFELLKYFAKNKNVLLSKEEIYRNVWKSSFPHGSRTVDQYVKVIRKKAFSDNPNFIETHNKLGYKFVYDIKE